MEERREQLTDAQWLDRLRRRFVDVASRRVGASDVDDVVQDALRIVAEKGVGTGTGEVSGRPPVAWCFQVLRYAIGNHYQREDTRRRRFVPATPDVEAASGGRAAESLDSSETLRLIEDALGEMETGDGQCARYLSRLVDGARPNEVAEEERLEPAVFYRRLYRCRQKLRELLKERGVDV